MAKFNVRYVHKISQTCVCKHTQYGHAEDLDGTLKWGQGKCRSSATCECTSYVPESYEMEIALTPDALGDEREFLRCLAAGHVLSAASKLRELRREADGKIVVFPDKSIWHSIILTPIV